MEARLEALERQVKALRERVAQIDHWHNTMHSPWYKRLWWFALGFRLCSLGRWYRAPWNESAVKYGD